MGAVGLDNQESGGSTGIKRYCLCEGVSLQRKPINLPLVYQSEVVHAPARKAPCSYNAFSTNLYALPEPKGFQSVSNCFPRYLKDFP